MPVEDPGIRLSPLDSKRFGITVARVDGLTSDQLAGIVDFCNSRGVQLLIARCRVEDVSTVHALGLMGFLLMDTLVYYERDLARSPVGTLSPGAIEVIRSGDKDQVEAIARECFRDYSGHYHSDPRLDRNACTELYASWARSCCEWAEPEGFVLVAGEAGRRVGFSSFRRTRRGHGELVLGGVLPTARGTGLYKQLTLAGMFRLQSSGAKRFLTSGHLSNWTAQASWTAAGLRPSSAYHTFHWWSGRP